MTERITVYYIINHLYPIGLIFKMSQMIIKTKNKVKNAPKSKEKENRKFIRSKMTYERYQINLIELSTKLNINWNFKYLLTWVDHFTKYVWTLPINNKDAVAVRNIIVQVYIRGLHEYFR